MDQHPDITWRGSVPIASRFDDPYFSLEDGLAETGHVFLAGNGLPDRFRDGFQVAELGFGTGLNFLATWAAWKEADVAGTLRFTSFELFPMEAEDMARALSVFPDVAMLAGPLLDMRRAGGFAFEEHGVELEIIVGDARREVAAWAGSADAWYLDGFAPARNPELWEPTLLSEVARHTLAGGTAATYSAAGAVRRALSDAGFTVERCPGYGRKRHMTVARMSGGAL
ncbi:tRNA (5-methylaminomethyl-2-thiouridine)(34)-methyltransferase MnmD [Boseongicola aestuarii]|uniref:tRNA 5-methylaminomethyl-2-thiouridine biosynthesis bifunctional protein MnmC n=1 Tax=Boseongicola aestuarii TaxID=1470561 RepID=A0A238J001_9RHOB|nr:tRNA (5-methylaminomethyl-2-thiouridine)(34)-methyltransferase MnmD [Boseongicola aestuarii]SMX23310.1 tRNA 5-methylaminomethyl-2-thiouridine biosynthesis bifunctional protein MnmC [Boseongicola aestuarii]